MENPAGARNTSRVTPANVVTPVRGQQKLRLFFLAQRIEARTGHPLYRFSAVRPVVLVGAGALIGPLARFEIHLYTRRGGRLCPLKGPLTKRGLSALRADWESF